MSPLLEKALEKVGVLPQAEQDAIALEKAVRKEPDRAKDISPRRQPWERDERPVSPGTGRKNRARGSSAPAGLGGSDRPPMARAMGYSLSPERAATKRSELSSYSGVF